MVNMRFHVVSLIAVFVALAVGVVLGAGPLQKSIDGSAPSDPAGDVSTLQSDLEQASNQLTQAETFIWAQAENSLPGTLKDLSVALILLPGTTDADSAPVLSALGIANASVSAEVQLSDVWTSEDQATFRQTLASAVSGHLTTRPADSSNEGILAQGLVEVLTTKGASQQLVKEMLTQGEVKLVNANLLPQDTVSALVLIGPNTQSSSGVLGAQSNGGDASDASAYIALGQAAASVELSVAVGQAAHSDQFIAVLREQGVALATVDQGGTAMSAVNVALALSQPTVAAYGQQIGAITPIAPGNQ